MNIIFFNENANLNFLFCKRLIFFAILCKKKTNAGLMWILDSTPFLRGSGLSNLAHGQWRFGFAEESWAVGSMWSNEPYRAQAINETLRFCFFFSAALGTPRVLPAARSGPWYMTQPGSIWWYQCYGVSQQYVIISYSHNNNGCLLLILFYIAFLSLSCSRLLMFKSPVCSWIRTVSL